MSLAISPDVSILSLFLSIYLSFYLFYLSINQSIYQSLSFNLSISPSLLLSPNKNSDEFTSSYSYALRFLSLSAVLFKSTSNHNTAIQLHNIHLRHYIEILSAISIHFSVFLTMIKRIIKKLLERKVDLFNEPSFFTLFIF